VSAGSELRSPVSQSSSLEKGWLAFLAYVLAVIVFGAVVRITGSGAGCGQHWPTCHGEVMHLPRSLETLIELTHRITSEIAGLIGIVLLGLTWRSVPARHPARRWALWSVALLVVEGLVGALLVRLSLVGKNGSPLRAVIMALHLVSTSALVTSILLAGWSLSADGSVRGSGRAHWGRRAQLAVFGALLLLVVSAAGAVTALGDTLYPVLENANSGGAVFRDSVNPEAHFLERIRGFHPIFAVLAATYLLYVAADEPTHRLRYAIQSLILIQVLLGVLNVLLGAPGWMQVVHLTVGTLLWLTWSELCANALFRAPCLN
jgi:heme a synthase